MAVNKEAYESITKILRDKNITLVAVSKTKPVEDILSLYELGQRDFGENYVQELVEKAQSLPKDIRWHFIGHLQSNKVKLITSFIHLVHGVDSAKLLREINKQAKNHSRIVDCLLQVFIADEETKFGLDEDEVASVLNDVKSGHDNIRIRGLMGMASFTEDVEKLRDEFRRLNKMFQSYSQQLNSSFDILSIGMSSDYKIAIDEGSTMVRIGSLLFGNRS